MKRWSPTPMRTESAGSLKETRSRQIGRSPEQTAHALSRRAQRLYLEGMYGEAEAYYLRALAVAEQTFGPDHLEIATALNNLGVVYKYLSRFAEARRVYKRSLTITE